MIFIVYFQVIQRKLTQAIQKRRLNCEINNLIFHQDNAPSHRAKRTLETIDFLGHGRPTHPPYSPDLTPMDFCAFPRFKSDLRGQRFTSEHELKMAIPTAVHVCVVVVGVGGGCILLHDTRRFMRSGWNDIRNALKQRENILRNCELLGGTIVRTLSSTSARTNETSVKCKRHKSSVQSVP